MAAPEEEPSTLPPPPPSTAPLPHGGEHIALIGLGAIGISFLALHLTYTSARVTVYDPRPDLAEHIDSILPLYLPSSTAISDHLASKRLVICASLSDAVSPATIVQEQGPENLAFKQRTWSEVLAHISPTAHLWSSTSGIPASQQLAHLASDAPGDPGALSRDVVASAKQRLLIVHPFNPPHLMPLIELVPSPWTSASALSFAKAFFTAIPSIHRPITLHSEIPGFVANRLSFVLLREACHLVNRGVCSVEDLDEVMRASLGPRWAVGGVFQMYNFGGGRDGMAGFLRNIGQSIDAVWKDQGVGDVGMEVSEEDEDGWKAKVIRQARDAYGAPTAEGIRKRDRGLKEVVRLQEELEGGGARAGVDVRYS